MRTAHCIVALVVLASLAVAAQAPGRAAPEGAQFAVFLRGVPIGVDEVTVVRTGDGVRIIGVERLGAPLSVTVRKAELRYGPGGRPLDGSIEGSIGDQQFVLRVAVTGTTAVVQTTQGAKATNKTEQIAADAVLLPSAFFGAYEALAERLARAKVDDELPVYLLLQGAAAAKVTSVASDRLRTADEVVEVRQYGVRLVGLGRSTEIGVWVDAAGRLARLTVPEQAFDVVRTDIASVSTRRETISRANDEQARIPANGFSLIGTVSQPPAKPSPNWRWPAVVLVGEEGGTDRDETVAGIPVFAQTASSLADAGFLVVRYDRRGVGQSGGRAEAAALADYAEDVAAAVRYARDRKDVDPKRVAVLARGDGAAAAELAAAHDKDIAALVLVGAAGQTGASLVLEQQRQALARLQMSDAEKQAKIQLQQKIQNAVLTGAGLDTLPADVRRQVDTPWFRSWLSYDPAPVLRKVRQPILIVQGELDRQVDPSNADRLAAMIKARPGQSVKVLKLPGLNHLLAKAATGELDESARPADKTVSQDALLAIEGWLKETLGTR
jgi:hypothetical protein